MGLTQPRKTSKMKEVLDLYKAYIVMWEYDAWGTAFTSMDKYKPNKEYEEVNIPLTSREILWADYIVFPFTNVAMKDAYEQLKLINPDLKIVFNVDFNYYQLSKKHPLHESFSSAEVISNIEDNIFYSDLTIVTNSKLSTFLVDKFTKELNESKYKDEVSKVEIGMFPLLIDELVIMENVELDVPELTEEEKKPLRVGMIGTNYTWEDLNSYRDLFKEVQEKMKDKVKFILFGFDGIDHKTQKSCFPKGFEFEHVKPCTIVHYYKQLRNLQLDILFIPLRHNEYNMTSENYNKFLEAGIFKTPTMVYDIFPYNEIVKNGQTGIILKKKKEFVERIEFFEKNRDELKRMGDNAYTLIQDNFIYHKDNLPMIDKIYTKGTNEK
jgi:glycosyltransferase involved in cell wall biosynthesis